MAVEINEVIVIDNDKNVNVGVITATSYSGENINLTGVVTAIGANFSGNVSVGGTLTYEDVTNIDSVGLITARSGINVLAGGIDVTGVTTASSFVGDGSQLTNILTLEATTSGTLSDGSKVIVNTDGTVSGVASSTTSATESLTPTGVEWDDSTNANFWSAAYDTHNNKAVICWRSTSPSFGYGKVTLGTISGTSITFTTPVNFSSTNIDYPSIVFDSHNNRVVIAYKNWGNSGYGTAVVGEISGNSISFGTPVVFESAGVESISTVFDSYNNRVVIFYVDTGNSYRPTAIVGEVNPSTNAISFGTPTASSYTQMLSTAAAFDSDNNIVLLMMGKNNTGRMHAGTVNPGSNSISFANDGATAEEFNAGDSSHTAVAYDTANNKAVVLWSGTSGAGKYKVVSIDSSGNFTFGTEGTYFSRGTGVTTNNFLKYEPTSGKLVAFFRPVSSTFETPYVLGTISGGGTTVTWESPVTVGSNGETFGGLAIDPNNAKAIFAYSDSGSYNAKVLQLPYTSTTTNLTSENFIGISDGAYSNGQTATIQLIGSVDDAQSGLTTARSYYVQNDGTLSLTPDSPSVFAGTAVSDTQLIVKG
jgi:hypothetical protein